MTFFYCMSIFFCVAFCKSLILSVFRNLSDEEKRIIVKKLVSKAKIFASEGELFESLSHFKQAYNLLPSEKIKSRIKRIQVLLALFDIKKIKY